jgi:hypothetical protein
MSESPATPASSGSSDPDDDRLVPDEKLPEDLQPEKNPLARDPDDPDDTDDTEGTGADGPRGPSRPGGTDGPAAGGMPDMGRPG